MSFGMNELEEGSPRDRLVAARSSTNTNTTKLSMSFRSRSVVAHAMLSRNLCIVSTSWDAPATRRSMPAHGSCI